MVGDDGFPRWVGDSLRTGDRPGLPVDSEVILAEAEMLASAGILPSRPDHGDPVDGRGVVDSLRRHVSGVNQVLGG